MFAVLNFTGALGAARRPRHSQDGSRPRSPTTRRQIAKLRDEASRCDRGRQGRGRHRPQDRQDARTISPTTRTRSAARRSLTPRTIGRCAELDPALHQECAGEPGAGLDEGPGRSVEIQLAADPALGAVHVAAVPVPPALQHLRPHGVRDLFAVVHDAAGGRRQPAGRGRACRASRACCSSCRRSTCTGSCAAPTSSDGSARSCGRWRW